MVVVPEPAVKGRGSFAAGAVDGAVGPAVEECADEAFGFAVCLGAAWPSADGVDAEGFAADRLDGGGVAGAVVGEQPFDLDAVAAVEGDGSAEGSSGGGGSSMA